MLLWAEDLNLQFNGVHHVASKIVKIRSELSHILVKYLNFERKDYFLWRARQRGVGFMGVGEDYLEEKSAQP
jgi:hypothetical protein